MVLGISWLWWAIGTFGITATALVIWLAPALVPQIAIVLFKFLQTKIGIGIAAAAIAFFVADVNRSLRDEHDFAARTAAFKQAQKDRDVRIARETREEVWNEIATQTAANAVTDKEVKEFHDALPIVPFANGVNPFRVGDASCRLRALAGYAGCGPASAQGVPQARSDGAGPGTKHPQRFRLPGFISGGAGGTEKSK